MGATEVERKLETLSNTQFKFATLDKAETLIPKIQCLCNLIGIRMESALGVGFDLIDEYFDDEVGTIQRSKQSLRVRHKMQSGECIITYKTPYSAENDRLIRFEIEVPCGSAKEAKSLMACVGDLSLKLNVGRHLLPSSNSLNLVMAVHNRRQSVKIQTDVAEYDLCFDKYFFNYPRIGFSHYFSEIEIELIGANNVRDQQLDQLVTAVSKIFNYKSNTTSKLERGFRWASAPVEDAVNVYTVMLDVIGYSRREAYIQKQLIQSLNHLAKASIKTHFPDAGDLLYIPTGDGMIIVFQYGAEKIIPMIALLQSKVREENSLKPGLDLEFRTAIHFGQVFRYSDINENLNYAGDGINMVQRAINFGGSGHILATGDIKKAIADVWPNYKDMFHFAGTRVVKHGVSLDIFNVYDIQNNFGSATPV